MLHLPSAPSTSQHQHHQPSPALVQHSYGTRIRQNSVIKPSARLRQSPDPTPPPSARKPRPAAARTNKSSSLDPIPLFPPPNVTLHPEDANSKVFLAIGRSFFSVNNCAMTIKDLAEMTLKFGLMCQNVSAAGQAITTYIRSHMQRCDAQQDHPLLLRHTLSGTSDDDDLLPALHSRSGGAHSNLNPDNNRATNFRRGTIVWYLSKATGAPCPFARAGIRLCEYTENGKVGPPTDFKDRHRPRRPEICGQKRKRLLRASATTTHSDSDSDSTSDGRPPPKVKLTLRLRPCLSASASAPNPSSSPPPELIDLSNEPDSIDCARDSMSVDDSSDDEEECDKSPEPPWSLPPYPRRSISIPCYTPITDSPYSFFPQPPSSFRRFPSVPSSIASPPPNSEEEDDDYHITMTGSRDPLRDNPDPDLDWDLDLDSDGEADGETETQWESPCPRSPSAPISNTLPRDVVVKQETTSAVQGMLDAWDDFDFGISDRKSLSHTASLDDHSTRHHIKVESFDHWDWHGAYTNPSPDGSSPILGSEALINVKQEECDLESILASPYELVPPPPPPPPVGEHDLISSLSPLSTVSENYSLSARRHSEWTTDFDEGTTKLGTIRARAQTFASLPSLPRPTQAIPINRDSDPALPLPPLPAPPSPTSSSFLVSLIQSMNMSSVEQLQNNTIAPSSLLISSTVSPDQNVYAPHVVVVHTCQPCNPAISATQVEGISVYQMALGNSTLLRRIDTDFVNISPIASYLSIPLPPPTTTTVVIKGSAIVSGTWLPLASAQAFVREHSPLPGSSDGGGGLLDVFLSDILFERFPPALQDFHRSNTPARLLNQFGPHFGSAGAAAAAALESPQRVMPESAAANTFRTGSPSSANKRSQPLSLSQPQPQKEPGSDWDVMQDDLNLSLLRVDSGARPVVMVGASSSSPLPMAVLIPGEEVDGGNVVDDDTPLSATEQEMFHALCSIPDWEKENSPPMGTMTATTMTMTTTMTTTTMTTTTTMKEDERVMSAGCYTGPESPLASSKPAPPPPLSPTSTTTTTTTSAPVGERPLRRSKRVANAQANAVAAQTRASSRRRSARNSLN